MKIAKMKIGKNGNLEKEEIWEIKEIQKLDIRKNDIGENLSWKIKRKRTGNLGTEKLGK